MAQWSPFRSGDKTMMFFGGFFAAALILLWAFKDDINGPFA
jgi:hypothetical protein